VTRSSRAEALSNERGADLDGYSRPYLGQLSSFGFPMQGNAMNEARAWVLGVVVAVVACGGDEAEGSAIRSVGVAGARGSIAAGASTLAPAGAPAVGFTAGSTGAAGNPSTPIGVDVAGSGAADAPAPNLMTPRAGSGSAMMPAAGSGAVAINPATCPPAPADAPPQAAMALAAVNTYRVPAGAGCATMIAEINKSAAAHCAYYAAFTMGDMCISNPHLEVSGCAGFTGATPGDRMKAAGYASYGGGEVMAFVNSAQNSVDTWVNSVWHRVPIIDPWTTHLGYGSDARCDTIDFGRGTPAPANTVVVYPYDGQINLPTSFNGANEGPMPPEPPTGWPSSTPISVYAEKIAVTEHVLTKDGDPTPIEHVWLDSTAEIVAQDMRHTLTNVAFMYGNVAFTADTKYRVKITGTYSGGALSKEWTFTTGAPSKGHR
jgi:uncharacterized protein YkwD